mgnify:CR=1 FL=1
MIVVMGTPGAGKSTIIRKFKEMHPDAVVVNFGTVMFDIASKHYGVTSRDGMRLLRRDRFREIQGRAAGELLKHGQGIIIDTHASVRMADGYYPGFPHYVLSKLRIDAFLYIRAPPVEIASRRERDTTRKRDPETLDEIKFHEMVNLSMVSSYAAYANAPIKFIINEDGKLDQTMRQFEECVGL